MGKADTISRIKKLRKHAESARKIGNIKEAEAFEEKATALMKKHNISGHELKGPGYKIPDSNIDVESIFESMRSALDTIFPDIDGVITTVEETYITKSGKTTKTYKKTVRRASGK